ncbi:uncharacterized protein LOC128958234 [Oppia nitens]|uniref:uncharacterized protein LOC128958234 n=1 Tax=Oppia nitens TaxID=1686743 RepID=UPI0023D9B045|nr:uncharacterized protein LOC128958234 [Oppia nitens]
MYRYLEINILITILLSGVCYLICTGNPIYSETFGDYRDYKEEYDLILKRKNRNLFNPIIDSPEITVWDIFMPFIVTFWLIFTVIGICFLICLVLCIISFIDFNRLFQLMEYSPCHGYKLLWNRLDRLKLTGVYCKEDGTVERYEPIQDERALYQDIVNRFQTAI